MAMKIKVNISTCPNDTYMFDAMLNHRIDTHGLEFDARLMDIEELNRIVLTGEPDVSKVSYAIVPEICDKYRIMLSGSALGRGNGPLIVSKRKIDKEDLTGMRVAIPGKNTTANMLLEIMFPGVKDKPEYLFSDIMAAVLNDEVDAGVLIHEGRFVYQAYDLLLMADLGFEWEVYCGLPLPLGAIAVSRRLDYDVQRELSRQLTRSVKYAMDNPDASYGFVKDYARELDDMVIGQHINLFVNRYSLDLGEEGREAVDKLLGHRLAGCDMKRLFI